MFTFKQSPTIKALGEFTPSRIQVREAVAERNVSVRHQPGTA
ncbi:hypothetical protein [Corynebacterium ulcerans]|uniref:Uncharacterized protein n=2 Tax=Corynebacterium ulcerans TaxID=65058 RepID=A0ABD7MUP4_CORUL|nr:hypothetical protein [Corynebacterium ulcerans]AKN75926.1 Hypothetical protein CulFRC58_0072 [Corynebacterium ulcerans FRC58]SNV10367.1 Uncharacterised protein [Corynebacterium ulcerans]SQG52509.1 Uncharacterised protein [Corynebacterium ulcerans]SQH02960.1 Uncharacterised protein [Corynebacterium ulcerans]BAM26271.1 hypothetical protein CULC0102_0071 [Corynebacterium ulcerans 0102]